MADFKKILPVLKVSDMQKSIAFYTGVLGFLFKTLERWADAEPALAQSVLTHAP